MKRNVCPFCKYINRVENKFCVRCGADLLKNRKTAPRLVMLLGDRHDAIYQLNYERNSIGRGEKNTVVFDDLQISKKHAAITYEKNEFWIEDIQSKNGVLLNGRKIKIKEKLFHGCVIKLGSTIIRFESATRS